MNVETAETAGQALAALSPAFAWTVAALTFVGLALGLRVIALRLTLKIGIGDGGNKVVRRAIRAHANFAEWVPLTLLCLLVADLRGVDERVLMGLGIALFVSRVGHGFGLSRFVGVSVGRTGGMTLNLLVLAAAAVLAGLGG